MEPQYTITEHEPAMVTQPGAMPSPGYRVTFRTATGHTGVVTVPAGPDLADRVHQAVSQEAGQIIESVTRTPPPYTGG